MFANSAYQTTTMDQQAYNRSFLEQLGDIKLVITLVVSAAFAAILLIVGNTMAMTVRERTKEIGVLKTLGFGRYWSTVACRSGALFGIAVLCLGPLETSFSYREALRNCEATSI